MPKLVNLIGKIFGDLKVIRVTQEARDGSRGWECECSCGKLTYQTTRHLNRSPKNGVVRSCGCRQIKRGKEHSQWTGWGEISGHWWSSHIKHSANCKGRADIEVAITKQDAWELFLAQERKCALSGLQLVISNIARTNTASLDRIDSTQGYTKDNIQWLHKDVNMMKRTYNQDYFLELCELISGHCPIK